MASEALKELSIQLAPKGQSKYKVKKGDTLSSIASGLGVGMDTISGYRSGNKDLIYEGEELSVGAPKKSESSTYVDEVKTQLNDTTEDEAGDDEYGTGKLRATIEETTKSRDKAFKDLKDISTETFDDEYKKRKLDEKKEKMSMLDSDIASKKSERDAAINKVRTNPGLSAAQMTGDIKKMSDYANNEINNLIAERNGVAGEYNSELSEIDKLVENAVKEKTLEYGHFDNVLKDLTSQVSEYTKTMREDLRDEVQNDQFDRQLAQALEIATMNANKKGSDSSNLQLKTDPNTGDPLYRYDPETGEITYINDEDAPEGGDNFDDIEASLTEQETNAGKGTAKWYNPFSWANYF